MRWRRDLAIALCAGSLLLGAGDAHALRIATYNILDYPNLNLASRQFNFRVIMGPIGADVIILQELKSSAGRDSFLNNVLNVVQPGQWASAGYLLSAESALLYKPSKVSV